MADLSSVQTTEGEHTVEDGMKLYTKTWKSTGETKARLVFIHGFSDHCNTYGILFPTLATRGITTYSFDQRGWGRSVHSDREKGLTGPTSRVLEDITSFLKPLVNSKDGDANAPLFLMGHSMGGAEVLCYIAEGPKDVTSHIRGYLLEAPFLAFHADTKPSPLTVFFGRLAGRLLPNRQMVFPLDEKLLSRDPQVQRDFVEDKLCHDTGTLEGLAGNLDRAADIDSGKIVVPEGRGEGGKTRVWLSHGTTDGVCDYHATERLNGRMGDVKDKELKLYEGWYHKLHAEPSPDRETYAKDVADWILARSGTLESGNTPAAVRSKL